MIGARAGDHVLVAGTPDPALIAALAATTGLNGETLVVNPGAARAALEAAAGEAGALIEFADDVDGFPDADASADLVVLALTIATIEPDTRTRLLAEAFRLLRPGGRLVVVDGVRRTGPFANAPAPTPADAILPWIVAAGGRAARQLGSAEGVTYYEAQQPR
jgi:SAM-dependent methyltransferase